MLVSKTIFWKPTQQSSVGNGYASVHLLSNSSRGSIADFLAMAQELRKTFPEALDVQLECHRVLESKSCEGCVLLIWNAHIKRDRFYEGWIESNWVHDRGGPNYKWSECRF